MGNVTLPTPVFVAGLSLCAVAGYLAGSVLGPDTPQRTTAKVASYETGTGRLCLTGESVSDMDEADADGTLCGTWSHSAGATLPRKGDTFRFVTLDASTSDGAGEPREKIVIFGTVVE
ncbi:MAG: hypothetical protein IT196_27915 [Acidimicrobiales bacterium]|nr:hypothetical protein [Acidimicrobiales bacterium]